MGIGAGSPAEARLLERPIPEGGGGFRLRAAPGSGDEPGAAATAASTDRGAGYSVLIIGKLPTGRGPAWEGGLQSPVPGRF